MLGELKRYDWKNLRAIKHYTMAEESAAGIPSAIEALATARDPKEAERFYWGIDNNAVFNEVMAESALPTVRCVLAALQVCTPVARPLLLEILIQIGVATPSDAETKSGNSDLATACLREIAYGAAIFFHLLENGTDIERSHCIDLLGICAEHDPHLKERTLWWLDKLAAYPTQLGSDGEEDPRLKVWRTELRKS